MIENAIPDKLQKLHGGEEEIRVKATGLIRKDGRLSLHLSIVEHAMDLADILRQYPTDDENLKVIQVLGMRIFNAFGASVNLALSGYSQNSALIMRDILETVFLLDFFRGDRSAIERWRFADRKEIRKKFSPVAIRMALDARDGFEGRKREEVYRLFSELAGHPTMKSAFMMRPRKEGDAVIGPFVETTALEAVLSEMGKLAVQAGEKIDAFFPENWQKGAEERALFSEVKRRWLEAFYRQ